jgi:hypothetical protein
MARYTNIKCGNCGHSFTGGYTPGNTSVLGPSKVHCPKCKIFNSTSSKPYSQFNFGDHLVFWIGRVIKMLLLGLLYGGFFGYLTGIGNVGMIIGIIVNIIFNYFSIKHQINETEKEDDKLSGLDLKEKYFNIINTEAQTALEYFTRGWAKGEELQWHKGAIEDYTKAIELCSNYAFAYYRRGVTKQKLNDFKGSIEDYTKFIEVDPILDDISLQTNPIRIIGKHEYPISNPSSVSAYRARARSKEKLKDFKGVIADYSKAIEIDPKRMNDYYSRGWAKYYSNDMIGACQDARKANELGLATHNNLSDVACK